MRRALSLFAVLLGASGSAAHAQVQPLTTTYDFPDYRVEVAFQSGDRGCVLSAAALENKGNRPLNYVYTRLLSVSAQGVTITTIGINFPPTIQGGVAKAVHADSTVVALVPCTAIQTQLDGSKG
jgi:hypothetical protein